mmetsp:Transcript_1874/g.3431  ORF Transcript_1874/g.3431 Transcript_1874/m.3431 type:complete len:243 (+) Transcript_1874:190-918(+)
MTYAIGISCWRSNTSNFLKDLDVLWNKAVLEMNDAFALFFFVKHFRGFATCAATCMALSRLRMSVNNVAWCSARRYCVETSYFAEFSSQTTSSKDSTWMYLANMLRLDNTRARASSVGSSLDRLVPGNSNLLLLLRRPSSPRKPSCVSVVPLSLSSMRKATRNTTRSKTPSAFSRSTQCPVFTSSANSSYLSAASLLWKRFSSPRDTSGAIRSGESAKDTLTSLGHGVGGFSPIKRVKKFWP